MYLCGDEAARGLRKGFTEMGFDERIEKHR